MIEGWFWVGLLGLVGVLNVATAIGARDYNTWLGRLFVATWACTGIAYICGAFKLWRAL
jgi:hypothetical protein